MPPLLTRSSRAVYPVFLLVSRLVQPILQATGTSLVDARNSKWKRAEDGTCGEAGFDPNSTKDIIFACLIPVLVLLSGLFAGLTLGYMSLDQTQLNVLSISGTP
jgi:metal transporter CNNM